MHAGIGDDDVEFSHRFLGCAEKSLHLGRFGNVGLDGDRLAALRRDRFDDFLRQFFSARVVDDDSRSIRR